MDNAATSALATALETEFDPLRRSLENLSRLQDENLFEEAANELIDKLPLVLSAVVAHATSTNVIESILATHFLEGVAAASQKPIRNTGRLMRADKAFNAIAESDALRGAVNTLPETMRAIEIRAGVVAKVVKGRIIQGLRDHLNEADNNPIGKARAIFAEQAKRLEDLSDNVHVHNIVQNETDLARGYGTFSVHQSVTYLRAHPFQELYRAENRVEWRDWPARWREQGGNFYKGVADYPAGRMIAPTGSKIWEDLANPDKYKDGTGSPFPPFAWNSGMDVRHVSADDLRKLGLGVDEEGREVRRTVPKPKKLDFNVGITFSADFDDDIKSALLDSLAGWVERKGEVVHK